MITIQELDHVAIEARDPEASARWYQEVLGLERRHADVWGDVPIMVCAGSSCVAIFPCRGEPAALDAATRSPRVLHFAFRVDRAGFDSARAELEARGLAVEIQDHQIALSLYFADPDGFRLEITTYDV